MSKDEKVGWHQRPNGYEFEQALGEREGQGSLVCCSPWACKELDVTERLKSNKGFLNCILVFRLFWRGGCFGMVLFLFCFCKGQAIFSFFSGIPWWFSG